MIIITGEQANNILFCFIGDSSSAYLCLQQPSTHERGSAKERASEIEEGEKWRSGKVDERKSESEREEQGIEWQQVVDSVSAHFCRTQAFSRGLGQYVIQFIRLLVDTNNWRAVWLVLVLVSVSFSFSFGESRAGGNLSR